MGTRSGSGSGSGCGGSHSSITPSYKQNRPSKLNLGKVFFGSRTARSRGSPDDEVPSDRCFIENGARLFEALITSCGGNANPIRMFSAKELTEATDDYDEGRCLASGLFHVYSGVLDGRPIAVKKGFARFFNRHDFFDRFLNEVVSLSQVNHRNVVRLLGCCVETRDPMVVYELVSNGSLYRHIHFAAASHRLPWAHRLRVALEVAEALNYLHTALHIPIVHGTVQSSSILLDDCYSAKVGNFFSSQLLFKEKMDALKGSSGSGSHANSDRRYDFRHRITEKWDVYGFGLVLIEVLTGKEPCEGVDVGIRNISLEHFISSTQQNLLGSVLDGSILGEANPEQLMACAMVAVRSITKDAESRPTMKELVQELRRIRDRVLIFLRLTEEGPTISRQNAGCLGFWEAAAVGRRSTGPRLKMGCVDLKATG